MVFDTLRTGLSRIMLLVLMGLLIISFAIWGIEDIFRGYGSRTLVAVGDTEINQQDYLRTQREVMRTMSSGAGRTLSLQEARGQGLDKRVLERLVGGAALDNHAKQLGLNISEQALLENVKNDPAFKDSTGNFSPIALQQALRNLDMSEQGYLAIEREHTLRRQLLSTVGRTATISPVFLDAFNEFNNETRVIRYVVVPGTAAGPPPAPTEQDLKTYYENNRAKFTQPEFRKIGVLAVTPETVKDKVTITEADLKSTFEREKEKLSTPEQRKVQQISFPDKAAANAAYQKIQSGADFVAVAKEQGLKESDIDLGLLKRADMADAAIAEAVFKLEKDKVSEPVTGELGKTVIVRVTEIKPGKDVTFEEAKPDLEKKLLKERAQTAIFDLHDRIEDERAAGTQLSEIGAKFNIPHKIFDQVDRRGQAPDGSSPDLPHKTDLLNAVFATDVGVENDPIDAKDDGLVWYELLGVTPEQVKPFDDVKQKVAEGWREEETRNRMAKHTDALVKQLNDGKSLDDLAKELNATVIVSEPLKRSSMTVNILPNAVLQAFALPQGGFGSAPTGIEDSRIVFQVDKVTSPPPLERASLGELKRRLANFVGEDIIGEYFTALEQRYGVNVNQQAIATLTGSETQ